HSAPDRARFLRSDRDRRRGYGYGAQGLVPLHAALQPVGQPGGDPALRPGVGWPANGLAADRAVSRRCEAAARRCAVRDGTPLGREAAAASRGLMPAKHIVGIPSWYGTARGPGGGYFRDQALALQAAGFRVAMLAPDIHTLRDLRRGRAPASRRARIS